MKAVSETRITSLPLLARGKVRDLYDLGKQLLLVATDRLSAFDVVFNEPIPAKGQVLTGLAAYWFEKTKAILPNHLISANITDVPGLTNQEREVLRGRSLLVKKGEVVPIECIVRGYLTGSGLKEYQQTGTVNGIALPAGLTDGSKLPEPLFTPTTKESTGHDRPITFPELGNRVGTELAGRLRDYSLRLYQYAANLAEKSGIIIADTKFEFAWVDGVLTIVDEIFTPDSSRFWPLDQYQPGKPQPSFDKQYVRDYLETLDWDKKPPAPRLPETIIARTSEKYREAYERIVGKTLTVC
ncbi:MAG TPA: phosphoribosylaminoimidazolesuccinocarboxamide synthase [Bacillota bacterium]